MSERLADSLPDSTNAEESQHQKLYRAMDRKHALVPGLWSLTLFLSYYHRQYVHCISTFLTYLSYVAYPTKTRYY